jgi:hypothetical protein
VLRDLGQAREDALHVGPLDHLAIKILRRDSVIDPRWRRLYLRGRPLALAAEWESLSYISHIITHYIISRLTRPWGNAGKAFLTQLTVDMEHVGIWSKNDAWLEGATRPPR